MINSQANLLAAKDVIREDDFSDEKNQIVFRAIKEAQKEKGVIDITILGEQLRKSDSLQKVGGYGYLMDISNAAGTSAHIEAYCEDLRQSAVKRSLIETSKGVFSDLQKGIAPYETLDRLRTKVEDIKKNKPKADSLYRHLLDHASEQSIADEVKHISPGANIGLKLGTIDELILPGGALTIIAGPTGHGKTLVKINFNLRYLELNPDKQAFFFSYEESRAAIFSLFLNTYINEEISKNNRASIKSYFRAEEAKLEYIAESKRGVFLKKKEEFFSKLVETKRLNIQYCDYSAEELIEAIHFLKKNTNVGLVTIDYVQLLRLLNKKNSLQRQEELKHICLILKDCAVDTGIPILLGAQFNRQVACENDLSPIAIGEAGDIERAANLIIGIWNRKFIGTGEKKRRDGSTAQEESKMYMEILKGRETGIGHSAVFDLNGNTGRITPNCHPEGGACINRNLKPHRY